MSKEDLAQVLAQELLDASNTQLESNLALSLRYYDADPGNVAEGLSDLVSPDVRDAIESSIAEIMGAITTSTTLATFDPVTPQDVEMAELETEVVHRQIFGKNRGAIILETAIRNAMLQRYAVIRATAGEDRVLLECVLPENFVWSNDLVSPFLSDARFFAERQFLTRAQLKEIGVSSSDADDAPGNAPSDEGFLARYDQLLMMEPAARYEDQPIAVWYCYLRNNKKGGYDCHLFVEPSLILKSYHVPFAPFATGVCTIRPGRFDGVSIFDRLQQIQSAKTYMLRQLALQAKLANQSRLAIRDRSVNPDDLQSDQLNPVIRCKNSPAEDMMPLPVQDVTSQLLSTLQWMDGIRREDGGASIDQTSPQMQVANQSAHAAERSYSVKELQTELMLNTIGETLVRSLYLLVHATLKDKIKGLLPVKRDKDYAMISPDQFPDRTDITVDMGITLGARQRRLGAIVGVIANQQAVMQTGGAGILVTPANLYAANMTFSRLSGLANPESYWTDPTSPEAMQTAQAQAMAQAQKAQMDAQLAQMALQVPLEQEKIKSEAQLQKQHMVGIQSADELELELEYKYFDSMLGNRVDEKKVDIQEAQLVLSAAQGAVETNREAATSAE